jgi:serine/threonine-protein kinase
MAPEQVAKGATVDRRADIWALGMCLHELSLGKLPYDGDDDVDVIRRLMAREPPTIAPEASAPIARVLERALAIDPDARFPTAAGMQRALEGAMKELGETPSSEDVAVFLRSELPDLARRRRDAVGKAIDEARERGTPITESRDEVAFAPTLVGDRGARAHAVEEARAIALTKRKAAGASRDDSQVTPSTALENEPIRIPKRSRGWLWATLVGLAAAGGAAVLWPPAIGPAGQNGSTGATGSPGSGAPPVGSNEPVSPDRFRTTTASEPAAPAVGSSAASALGSAENAAMPAVDEMHADAGLEAQPAASATPVASASTTAPAVGSGAGAPEVVGAVRSTPGAARATGSPAGGSGESPPSEARVPAPVRAPAPAPVPPPAASGAPSSSAGTEDDPNNPYN